MTSNNHCPGCNCQVPRQRAPLSDADRAVLQRILDEVRPAAARARVTADKKRGVETPEWVQKLSRGGYVPGDSRPYTLENSVWSPEAPYSDRTRVLAQELAEKAADNLRKTGHTVTFDEETGRHTVIAPAPAPEPQSLFQRLGALFSKKSNES